MKKIFYAFVLLSATAVFGQDDKTDLQKFMQEDSVDINTIATYPDNVRQYIYEVATQPQALSRIGDLQKKSSDKFKNLLAPYSKEEQNKIWNLTRYDNLVARLAKTKGKKKRVEEAVKDFPEEIREDARNYGINNHELMVSIDKLNQDFDNEFVSVAAGYSAEEQSAFRRMLGYPEVLSILHDNMHLTVTLGDFYKRNPGLVKSEFEALNLELARQKAKDTEEWKQSMKNNPEAANEMKQAAQEYAKENGYSENDYRETSPVIIEHYHYYPYPFWCGYPWWYEYHYWYPYPYWYHWGFYSWHGEIIWIGEPSWYFVYWHFHHHHYYHHFHDYPYLTNHYFNYYHGPRRSNGSNTREVNRWATSHQAEYPRNFLTNDAQRVERIREYGALETKIEQQQKANPGAEIKRDEFIQQYPNDYPHLQRPKEEIVKPVEAAPAPLPAPEKQEQKTQPKKTERPEYKNTPPVKPQVTPRSQPQHRQPVQVKPKAEPQRTPKSSPTSVPKKRGITANKKVSQK